MTEGLVSVVIPMKNGAATVARALSSVVRQTYREWEAIVVDDGSTDDSAAIVRSFAAKDARIRVLREPASQGAAQARNRAIQNARGAYIALLDCDDAWHAEKLSRQLAFLYKTRADFVCTSYRILNARGEEKKTYRVAEGRITRAELLKENIVCASSVLGKAALFRRHPFSTQFFHEDYALWLTFLCAGAVLYAMGDVLTDYALSAGGRSRDKVRCARERWKIYRAQEKMSLWKSGRVFLQYAVRGVKKYL